MEKVAVNLDELAFLLHRGKELPMECFLDLDSGKIHYIPTEPDILSHLLDEETNPELVPIDYLAKNLLPEGHRIVYIPDQFNHAVFDLMTGFLQSHRLPDPIYKKLIQAVQTNGGYEFFHNILEKHKNLYVKFIDYRDEFFRKRAIAWLNEQDIPCSHTSRTQTDAQ